MSSTSSSVVGGTGADAAPPRASANPFTFSIVCVCRNEADILPRLFESARAFMREGGRFILVDTGSTDETTAIAREHGCEVHEVGNEYSFQLSKVQARKINTKLIVAGEKPVVEAGQRIFHFANARNRGSTLSPTDWLLQIDAADVFEALDYRAIQGKLDANPTASRFCYQLWIDKERLEIQRFYDRRQNHWIGCVHEAINWRANEHGAALPLDGAVLRVRHLKKHNKVRNYVGGMALDHLKQPQDPRWLYYLGREFFYMERWRSALALLERHGNMATAWAKERNGALCYCGRIYEKLGQTDKAVAAYMSASMVEPTRREPWIRLGWYATNVNKPLLAACFAAAAMQVPYDGVFAEDCRNYEHHPHHTMYWAMMRLKRYDEAWPQLQICRKFAPDHERFVDRELDDILAARSAAAAAVPVPPTSAAEPIAVPVKAEDTVPRRSLDSAAELDAAEAAQF